MPGVIDERKLTKHTTYVAKDLLKFQTANKLISRGSANSSSHAYAVAAGDKSNCGVYDSNDIVGISAEGNRRGRVAPDYTELDKAIKARVKEFITDTKAHRHTSYNIGEREVEAYLIKNGYTEQDNTGHWQRSTENQ